MTATSSLDHQAMDFSSLEDKMDLASSPFPHLEDVEDLDFEFDQMDNRPPDPTTDNMMDDATEPGDANEETAVQGDVEFFEDETKGEEGGDQYASNEFAMHEVAEDDQEDEEEILYEDEEDSTVIINKPDDENEKYLQNPEQDTEDLFETDETLDSGPVDDSAHQETAAGQDTGTHPGEKQAEDDLKPQQDTDQTVVDENQTTRDDGDGPTVDPTVTEYLEDPDLDRPAQPTEADLQVEESYEDALDEEGAISVFPEHDNADDSAPPVSAETIPQGRAVEVQDNVRVLREDLHSVRVVYQGIEYSLFPPTGDDSTSYFLEDSSLAIQPFDMLLKSCREVVGKPEELDHHDELVLDVPTMGLHICEDSKYASQIKLSDVVEVYLSLHRNENREEIQPLYCSLTTRVCLSTQFSWLRDQAKEGFTFSQIAAQHVDTPVEESDDTDPALTQDFVEEQPKDSMETTAGKQSEDSNDAGYSADGQGLQSDPRRPSDDLPVTSGVFEEAAGADNAYTFEDPQLESGVVPPIEEGQDAIFDPITAAEPEPAHSSYDAEPDTVAPEPEADAEVSEFFQDAIDEPIEDEQEDVQERAEDQSILREAVAEEQTGAQSLLAGEEDRDNTFDNRNDYDADEFLIKSDDESAGEADAKLDDDAATEAQNILPPATNGNHANGDRLPIDGTDSSAVPPTTPSKKTAKRKVSDEEDDFVLDLDTPEPKRRRPS